MSGFIPDDVINRVRDSFDVVSLVSRYLALKKTGANYKALCPFHKEKTPSFTVSPSRQTFHCFGCGKGGNVFHFLMAVERISFPEAVRSLAKEAGIEIPDTRAHFPGAEAEADERTRLYEANRRAADFFARALAGPDGGNARDYVAKRGISQEMVERCVLGYAPDSWDALLNAARAAGVVPDLLVKAGLAIQRDDSPGCYDRFRNRLIFPIFDVQDRVIGFGARALDPKDDVKYINTPETPVFSKGRNLYGLNWARKAIADAKRVAVVEGYTDVIMAHQHGCTAVVATLGTALTRDHIRALRRFAERIDVVFDSDPAGLKAAERSMEIFLSEGAGELVAAGFDVRIAAVEGGKDPCDVILAEGPAPFIRALDAAEDVFTAKIRLAYARHDLRTIDGKTRAIDEVLTLAAAIPNALGRELRVDQVIRTLAAALDLNDDVLRARLDQIERRRRPESRAEESAARPSRAWDPAERGLIEGLLAAPELAAEIFGQVEPADFTAEPLAGLFTCVKDLYESDGAIHPTQLLDRIEDPDAASLVSAFASSPPRKNADTTARDCLRALLRRRLTGQLRETRRELDRATAAGDQRLADDLNLRFVKLQREVHAL